MSRLDVVIVGGGPAGLSTALHLRRLRPDCNLVVLEKARYPREKYCAGGLGDRAIKLLARLGIEIDVPSVRFRSIKLRGPTREFDISLGGELGRVVRRLEFDHALAKETLARGIPIEEGVKVSAVQPIDGGARVLAADGRSWDAKVVVGADGVGSVVRRAAGLGPGVLRASVIECDTKVVEADLARDTLIFDASVPGMKGYGWDFPTIVDGQPKVCRGVYVLTSNAQENVKGRLAAYLRARGISMDGLRLKPFGERGLDPREPLSRPHLLLVGEAAGIDIATGEGIAQAIHYGALAGPVIANALDTGDLAFSGWRRRVVASGLGAGLSARGAMWATWYSTPTSRAWTEGLLYRNPAILKVFAGDFAGELQRRAMVVAAARMPDTALRAALALRARSPDRTGTPPST